MIGSPSEVSGYIVTDGGAAELVEVEPAEAEVATADAVAVVTDGLTAVADRPIADEAIEETAEASCRLSRGEASAPVKASSGRRCIILLLSTRYQHHSGLRYICS